ncbi:hypothetical protein [Polymorphobacter megasporae]|uniref:hypothetical protein n=1 Tax=Glacieibacterium megasporae TaxID=2835787 RepID=UPI001CAA77AA|nr:hypothetical protein [Polymorphobacter megasporae]UAJ09923.1 hypothetical protein KTC28_16780 [Polymorphobacter megasporae]
MMLENRFDYHVQRASAHLGDVETATSFEARNTHRELSKWHMSAALTEGVGFVPTCAIELQQIRAARSVMPGG